MTVEQFKSVNGFSNAFFGWGGEDDDLHRRFGNLFIMESSFRNKSEDGFFQNIL